MKKEQLEISRKETSTMSQRYIQFNLGAEVYAIPLLTVKEVISVPKTTPVPNIPSYYKGIMNLRGKIISILDLRKKLGVTPLDINSEEAVIIVELNGINIGVIVDSINKVLHLNPGEVEEIPEISTQVNTKFVEGVYNADDAFTLLINLEGILDLTEIKQMQRKSV